MRRRLTLTVTICLFLCLMSGCAKKEKKEIKKEEGGAVKIRWMVDPAPARKEEIFGFYKRSFSKGIVVDVNLGYTGSRAILAQIASGNPPDLFTIYDPMTFLVYMEKGALLDLSPYMKQYKLDPGDFWPALRPYMEYKGRIYGLPPKCDPFILYYNKKMFDEAGIAYPDEKWTWKELLAAAEKLTIKNERTGRYIQFGLLSEDPDMFVWQNGGWRYSKDGKRCVVNSPEAKEALRWYYNLMFKHHVMPTPSEAQNLAATTGCGVTVNLFAVKKVAMLIQGRCKSMVFRKDNTLDWNIAPVPRGRYKVTKLTSRIYAIPRNSKHKDEAFKFLNYLAGPGQYIIAKNGEGIPSRRSIGNSKEFLSDPDFPKEDRNRIYLDEMNYARAPEFSPYVSEIEANRIWQEEINLCWNKKQSPDEALDKIAARINKLIQQNLAKKK